MPWKKTIPQGILPVAFAAKTTRRPQNLLTTESDVPSIQCVEVESRSRQVKKSETPSQPQERSVLSEKDMLNKAASCNEEAACYAK